MFIESWGHAGKRTLYYTRKE